MAFWQLNINTLKCEGVACSFRGVLTKRKLMERQRLESQGMVWGIPGKFYYQGLGNAVFRPYFPSNSFIHQNMDKRWEFGKLCSLRVRLLISGVIGEFRECQTSRFNYYRRFSPVKIQYIIIYFFLDFRRYVHAYVRTGVNMDPKIYDLKMVWYLRYFCFCKLKDFKTKVLDTFPTIL